MYTLYEEQQGKRHQTLVPLDDCVHQRRRCLALLSRIYKYVELNKIKLHRYLLTHSQVLLPTKQMADKACVLETLKELLPPLRQSSQLKREQPKNYDWSLQRVHSFGIHESLSICISGYTGHIDLTTGHMTPMSHADHASGPLTHHTTHLMFSRMSLMLTWQTMPEILDGGSTGAQISMMALVWGVAR